MDTNQFFLYTGLGYEKYSAYLTGLRLILNYIGPGLEKP